LILIVGLAGCGGRQEQPGPVAPPAASGQPPGNSKVILLNGAGASFPYPIYSRWIADYMQIDKNVKINYQSIGSGAGIEQFSKKIIDFGASDAPVSDAKTGDMAGEFLHIPTVAGPVAIIYNLPGVKEKLKFTPDILADIFLGQVKKWNDSRLVSLNPGVKLPDLDIAVVHRSDGSGTTYIFTDYLSAVSPAWQQQVGRGTAVSWPTGLAGKGSEGVSRQVQALPGGIGYVELSYALLNKLAYGLVQNSSGQFSEPSLESTLEAAATVRVPDDLRLSIVNAPGPGAYPIAGYTYILVYKEQEDYEKGQALARFLWWAIHEGEKKAAELAYAPLPAEIVQKVEDKLQSMTHQGQPLLGELEKK
jgi:phosphate transport system substrate-binding protein